MHWHTAEQLGHTQCEAAGGGDVCLLPVLIVEASLLDLVVLFAAAWHAGA